MEVTLEDDCRGGNEDCIGEEGITEDCSDISRSISWDSIVSTTEEPWPPNSVVEPMLGPEERTLSRSKPASSGSS